MLLNSKTGVIVGASNDKTGNLKYGGDWVLESTGQDIELIYWTNAINSYSSTLLTLTISTSSIITQEYLDSLSPGSWPITIQGNGTDLVTITLGTDITLTSSSQYFIIGSDYIGINGQDHIVTLDGSTGGTFGYDGLVKNGTSIQSGFSNITIENIDLIVSPSNTPTLNNSGGWIGQSYFGNGVNSLGVTNCLITNCYSTGIISVLSGGIFGSYAGYNGSASATNCYSTGIISGILSGGIFGFDAGASNGSASATNCYSTGEISGILSGGIFGLNAGYNGSASATNCYSIGSISGANSGGIFGLNAGYNGSASATNCYSIGSISGANSGGIFGQGGLGGFATATNCYSLGTISGVSSGGIFGKETGSQGGFAAATNCYSLGTISGELSGGIFGQYAGYNGSVSATNCYSLGTISGVSSGGIFGQNVGSGSGSINMPGSASATKCYSSGEISGESSGGIFGSYAGYGGSVSATNCYSIGGISGESSGGIFGSYAGNGAITLPGSASATNCYSSGEISGGSVGGIFGSDSGMSINGTDPSGHYSTASAINCYSSGKISGSKAGGIIGNANDSTGSTFSVYATNCYSSGVISGGSAGGIVAPDINVTQTNCFAQNGSWIFTNACNTLTSINSVWFTFGSGSNNPFLLTSFNKDFYQDGSGNDLYYIPLNEYNVYTQIPQILAVTNSTFSIISVNNNYSGSLFNGFNISNTSGLSFGQIQITDPTIINSIYTLQILNTLTIVGSPDTYYGYNILSGYNNQIPFTIRFNLLSGSIQYLSTNPITGSTHSNPKMIDNGSVSTVVGYSKFVNLNAFSDNNNNFYLPDLSVSDTNTIYTILNISKKTSIYINFNYEKKNKHHKIKIKSNKFKTLIWNSYLLKWVTDK